MNRLLRCLLPQWRIFTCHLQRLPSELLLTIAGYLSPNIRDLNALLRTNRFLNRLLTPMFHSWVLSAAPDRYGRRGLRNATARGTPAVLTRLLVLANGVGVDASEPVCGTTALAGAIMLRRADAVGVLLRHGASLEVGDNAGWTPLHYAALSGDCAIVAQLLNHASSCVRAGQGCRSGATPLHFAAGRGDNDVVELLLHNGANAAAVDGYGLTVVEYAVVGGWPKTVQLHGGFNGRIKRRELAELRQRTVLFRWENMVRKEEALVGMI